MSFITRHHMAKGTGHMMVNRPKAATRHLFSHVQSFRVEQVR